MFQYYALSYNGVIYSTGNTLQEAIHIQRTLAREGIDVRIIVGSVDR